MVTVLLLVFFCLLSLQVHCKVCQCMYFIAKPILNMIDSFPVVLFVFPFLVCVYVYGAR